MAKRMIDLDFVDSDRFLEMPPSAQNLYFHLCIRTDDYGFVSAPKKIQRMVCASEDDLKLLVTKKYIIPFKSGVIVVADWNIHNSGLRKDRRKPTLFQSEFSQLSLMENGSYQALPAIDRQMADNRQTNDSHLTDSCQSNVSVTKHNLTKHNLTEKERKEKKESVDGKQPKTTEKQPKNNQKTTKNNLMSNEKGEMSNEKCVMSNEEHKKIPYQEIINFYNEICSRLPKVTKNTENRKKAINARFKEYGEDVEVFKTLFTKANESDFLCGMNNNNWSANFDWLLKQQNMAKVLEDRYINKEAPKPTIPSRNIEDFGPVTIVDDGIEF